MKKQPKQKGDSSASQIMNTVYAFRDARILLTAYELDLFSVLDKTAKPSTEVAGQLGTDPRATDRLMNALCAMKLLTKKKELFANSPLASQYLVRGKPEYLAGLMHSASLWHTWSTLTDAVRKGSTVLARGHTNERGADWLNYFIAAMHARAVEQAPRVVKLLDLKGVSRILDVGGGSAAFSMAFVRARKGISAVVFDLPNVVPLTKTYIGAEHLDGLIDTHVGDYTIDPLGSGYDLVFLSAIIHSNSPEINRFLFRKASDALTPGGQLVVLDHIMRDDRTTPVGGTFFALNMLVGTEEGDTYTESEVTDWMKAAGFKQVRKRKTPFGTDLMIGRKSG
jgi:SAM-dependent methyltransferase